MIRQMNKTFERDARIRSNSRPAKGTIPSERYNTSQKKGTPVILQKMKAMKVLSGSTRIETSESSRPRIFSETSTPVSQQKKSFGFGSDKASSNGSQVRVSPSKANNGFNPNEVMNVRWLQ